MKKKVLVFVVMAAFLITASAFAEHPNTTATKACRALTGEEPLPNVPAYPYNPDLATQSPGVIMGTTWYDYQTNGSTGNRVAITDSNTIYVAWMNAYSYPPPPRHIFHNWRDAYGNWNFELGLKVDDRQDNNAAAGYTTLDIYQGYRGAITYHYTSPDYVSRLALDAADYPGYGYFERYNMPNMFGGFVHIWPYIAVDRNNRIHVVMTYPAPDAGDSQDFIYVRSADGGQTWTTEAVVDTLMTISTVIDASPVSDKVIIAYTHPIDAAVDVCQAKNDIYYILSQNGIEWDFRHGKINVTNYETDNDSLWAYTDMDVIFDYNDNFHLVWTANWTPEDCALYWPTNIMHYNSSTQEINTITCWPDIPPGEPWPDICGAWNLPVCKMNLGVHELNILFATWTQFDSSDVSAAGYGNGEIFMSYTYDGTNWEEPVNLTNSPTPRCYPEECDSDHWSSLADEVNDTLHIFYVNDKDAGGIPQTEGVATENPMMYLAVSVDTLVGIDDETIRPVNFSLNQNYPNPFNAKTSISFELKEASPVLLEVFDLTGAKVTTLADEFMSAGSHSITWNAENVASGVYYYRLKAGVSHETRQAVLIK